MRADRAREIPELIENRLRASREAMRAARNRHNPQKAITFKLAGNLTMRQRNLHAPRKLRANPEQAERLLMMQRAQPVLRILLTNSENAEKLVMILRQFEFKLLPPPLRILHMWIQTFFRRKVFQ